MCHLRSKRTSTWAAGLRRGSFWRAPPPRSSWAGWAAAATAAPWCCGSSSRVPAPPHDSQLSDISGLATSLCNWPIIARLVVCSCALVIQTPVQLKLHLNKINAGASGVPRRSADTAQIMQRCTSEWELVPSIRFRPLQAWRWQRRAVVHFSSVEPRAAQPNDPNFRLIYSLYGCWGQSTRM